MDKLDILNREEFVSKLIILVENISNNKSSACFALNGAWGCGKSFVLDMFQEQLEQYQLEGTATDKYLVIRYNCWMYDYYEEPLIAIVSALMDIIEEKTKLFPDTEKKSKMLGMLKAVGVSLLSIGADAVKAKTGLDVEKAYKVVKEGSSQGSSDFKDEHEYDAYFNFNKILDKLSNILKELSKDYTVVLIVDELDRCLPQYTVKILERLHHLTEGQNNIITILSMDKTQLMSSIENLFGFKNPEKYLEKFINFEVKLNSGKASDKIIEKYADYVNLFDNGNTPFDDPVEECLSEIFRSVDIRMQEHIVNKAMIAHKLLFQDKKDYSFMCMEILIAVMICVYKDYSCITEQPLMGDSLHDIFLIENNIRPKFSDFFEIKFADIDFVSERHTSKGNDYILPNKLSLYSVILNTWSRMHSRNNRFMISYEEDSVWQTKPFKIDIELELRRFGEMIKMMS